MAKAKTDKQESFESSLMKLEKVVTQLEEGELPLEEAIKAFETGSELAKLCEARLKEARKKIEVLVGGKKKSLDWEEED